LFRKKNEKISNQSEDNNNKSDSSDNDEVKMVFDTKEAREEIPKEDGRQESNVKRFIDIVDKIYESIPDRETTTEADRAKLVRIVRAKLEDRAYEIADFAPQNWPAIKRALQNNLTCPTDLQTLLSKISSCSQRQEETISDFAQRIRMLGRELETAEKILLEGNQTGLLSSGKSRYAVFINGLLNQNIRTICQSKTTEFEKAVDTARQEEARISSMIQQAIHRGDTTKLINVLANNAQNEERGDSNHKSRKEVFFRTPERERRSITPERNYRSERSRETYHNRERSPEAYRRESRDRDYGGLGRFANKSSYRVGRRSESPYRAEKKPESSYRTDRRSDYRSPYRGSYERSSRSPYRSARVDNFYERPSQHVQRGYNNNRIQDRMVSEVGKTLTRSS
jgi:hypothetical protein